MALPVNLLAVVDEMDNLAPKRSQPPSQHSRLGRSPRPFDALDCGVALARAGQAGSARA